jgi:hypothetical protein
VIFNKGTVNVNRFLINLQTAGVDNALFERVVSALYMRRWYHDDDIHDSVHLLEVVDLCFT